MDKTEEEFMNYVKSVDIDPDDYTSEQEASLALPTEMRLFKETNQKYKVQLSKHGDQIIYAKRTKNGHTGPDQYISYNWKQNLNESKGYNGLDKEVNFLEELVEVILEDINNE